MSSEMVVMRNCVRSSAARLPSLAFHWFGEVLMKGTVTMTKTLDTITEIVRDPKHAFRKADDRPVKAQKHRYERRKIKEFIKLGDWAQESPA